MKRVLFFFSIFILFTSLASAAEFDNSKRFIKDETTSKYGKIEIDNWFGFGGKIATYELKTNTDQCLIECHAEGTATLYESGQLFTNLSFYDTAGKKDKIKKSSILIYSYENYTVEIPTYEKVCSSVFNPINATIDQVCNLEKTGTTSETRSRAVPVEYKGETLEPGTYEWRIEGKKNPEQNIDWVGLSFGNELTEWAWWNTAWTRKKQINISNYQPSILTNYSVKVDVAYDSDMQADFGDIRFVNSTETEELGQWNETTIASTNSSVWVYMPSLSTGNNTIWMYYGNPLAADTYNISRAFILGDHFSGNILSSYWQNITSGGTAALDNGVLRLEGGGVGNYGAIHSNLSLGINHTMRYKGNYTAPTAGQVKIAAFSSVNGASPNICGGATTYSYLGSSGASFGIRNSGSAFAALTTNSEAFDTYDLFRNQTSLFGQRAYGVTSNTQSSSYSTNSLPVCLAAEDTGSVIEFDWLYVRKLQTPEPVIFQGQEIGLGLTVTTTLLHPVNVSNYTEGIVNFNVSLSVFNGNLSNVTIFVYNQSGYVVNRKINTTLGNVNYSINISETINSLPQGIFHWNALGCAINATSNSCSYSSDNRSINITFPVPRVFVYLDYPPSGFNTTNSTLSFNATIQANYTNLTDSQLWIWNSTGLFNRTNLTITGNTSNISTFTVHNILLGSYSWNILGCGDQNCSFNNTNRTFSRVAAVVDAESYALSAWETQNRTFLINLSLVENSRVFSASLMYNGTAYPGTVTNTTSSTFQIERVLDIPQVARNTSKNFYWAFILDVGTELALQNSTFRQQNITVTNFTNLVSGFSSINYTVYDEETLNITSSPLQYTAIWYLGSGTEKKNISYNLQNAHNFSFFTSPNNYTFRVNSVLRLQNESLNTTFALRIYEFSPQYLNNNTFEQFLYLPNSSRVRNVPIEVKDAGLRPMPNVYVSIYRYYILDGKYRLVENRKTDDFGQIIARLIENDVRYKIEFKDENATLLKTSPDISIICQDSVCKQQFVIVPQSNPFNQFTQGSKYNPSITFNNATRTFAFTWNDVTGEQARFRFEVTRQSFNGTITYCNITSFDAQGFKTCAVPSGRASYVAQAFRMKTGSGQEIRIALLNKDVDQPYHTFKKEGLFMWFILLMTLVGVGAYSPTVAVGLYVIGFLAGGWIGIIAFNLPIFIGVAVLGGIFMWAFRT